MIVWVLVVTIGTAIGELLIGELTVINGVVNGN
jgi:hypothetical protein